MQGFKKECSYCGKIFGVKKNSEFLKRKYCSQNCCHSDPNWKKKVGDTLKGKTRKISQKNRENLRRRALELERMRHKKWLDKKVTVHNGWENKTVEINLTNGELEKYREIQKTCEICGRKETKTYNGETVNLCADHDHKTGEFRGLLCCRCNRALGWFEKYRDKIVEYVS